MAKFKGIYCEWVDANSISGWSNHKDKNLKIAYECKTLGFLIKETKEELIIAAAVHEDEANAIMCIPKGWIRKRKNVKI